MNREAAGVTRGTGFPFPFLSLLSIHFESIGEKKILDGFSTTIMRGNKVGIIGRFDQLRGQLNAEKTIEDEVGDGYKTFEIYGKPTHIIGYLQDFLFTPERARTPIKQLSGGERNRVLLAKLFAKPANVIVLDADFYKKPKNELVREQSLLADLETQLAEAFERWGELEARK